MYSAFFPRRDRKSFQPLPAPAVGLILSDVSNPFFAEIIPAIEQCLGAAGFTTLLGNASEDCAKEARLLKAVPGFHLPPATHSLPQQNSLQT